MYTFLITTVRRIGYFIAACIVMAALLVSITHLLAPVFDKHRGDIEKWTSDLLSMPVKIHKIEVSWYQYEPEVLLDETTVLDPTTKQPILQIKTVRVFFSIMQSIIQRKVVPIGLMISGANVNIYRNAAGEIAVQGFPALKGFSDQPYQHETKLSDMLVWLANQPSLALKNIDVQYTGVLGLKRFITIHHLSINNVNGQHVLEGNGVLHQDIPTELTLEARWQGDSADLAKIKANIYLYASGLSMTQWLSNYTWHGWQLQKGIVNAKIWAAWDQGQFHRIQTMVESYGLSFYSTTDKSTHAINRLSGSFGWKQDGQNQVFAGDDVLIDLPAHLWPSSNFNVVLSQDVIGTLSPKAINIGYVDLEDAQDFLNSSSALPDSIKNILQPLQLKGGLLNAAVTLNGDWHDPSHISFEAKFSRIAFASSHKFPGLKNFSGVINWNGIQGDLTLDSDQTVLNVDTVFVNPILLDEMTGDILWQRDANNQWQIQAKSVHVLNTDLAADVQGKVTLPLNDASPQVDITGSFTLHQASHVTRYLPLKIFDANLDKWLQAAFLSGEVQEGNAVLRGTLSDFPFGKGNGQFLISGQFSNVNFRYAPDWPMLENLNGKLVFSGYQMVADVDKGQTLDIPISNVHGLLKGLGGPDPLILTVQSDGIQTDFVQGLRYVHNCPLEKSLGKMFSGIEITGPLQLSLALIIPLINPDDTQVQGRIDLKDTLLNLVPWKLLVTDLNGQLYFTENTALAKGIQGKLFNKPMLLSIDTLKSTKSSSMIQATITNNLSIADVEGWLKLPATTVMQGATDVTVNVNFALNQPVAIHLQTNLVGIKVDLPAQYAKKASDVRALSADITVQENQPMRIKTSYGNLLSAALTLDRKNDVFSLVGCNLSLGSAAVNWPPTAGLYISGTLDQLDWDKVKYYSQQAGSLQTPGSLSLRQIDLKVRQFNLLGQQLTQVGLQVTPLLNGWNINITSPEVVGQITIPAKMTAEESISAHFQQLNLHTATSANKAMLAIDVKSLPSISFVTNQLNYNGMPFGRVNFKTAPIADGLAIESLNADSQRMNLHASGTWRKSTGGYTTALRGSAIMPNVTALLESMQFNVHNLVSSSGKFNFNLNWQGAPFAPSLGSLRGTASFDLKKGRIIDLGEAGDAKMDLGRMLNIFSLQTIPRRLTLDFSDVFQKGYSFDVFHGDVNFDRGGLYTSNTYFDGPVARVDIFGRIGLVQKDYDLTLSVLPYVTSSIPVAATLLAAPWVGVAALAVNTVIGSQVSKAAAHYYSVRGPWSNPSWESVSATAAPKNKGH